MIFRRRRSEDEAQPQAEDAQQAQPSQQIGAVDATPVPLVGAPPAPRPNGPWDVAEVGQPAEGRVDLGGLLVPIIEGMELRVEVADEQIVAATVIAGQSALQLQPFAAPRNEGIWVEVRQEIASGVTQGGGLADPADGPLGPELRAHVPLELPDGTQGTQLVRFVGCDGPRWFLRGVLSGEAAVKPETAAALEEVFRGVVVVRGSDPMAPREPIPLRLPPDAVTQQEGEETEDGEEGGRFGDSIDPFARGPEITEVR